MVKAIYFEHNLIVGAGLAPAQEKQKKGEIGK